MSENSYEATAFHHSSWLEVWLADLTRELEGKILTIIDASVSQGQQNKCLKDLIFKDFGFYKGEVYDVFGKTGKVDFGSDPRLGSIEIK